MTDPANLRVAVIGAGPVGIAAGRELLRNGFSQLTIFETAAAVGGTWHLHSYPGLACDVKAPAHTFPGEPNPQCSAPCVQQTEIGLEPHLCLNSQITKARDQGDGEWRLTTEAGDEHGFGVVIDAIEIDLRAIVKPERRREYNDWIAAERGKYAWGVDSYDRTPTGHTPFLFPGDLNTFRRHRDETGLRDFDAA